MNKEILEIAKEFHDTYEKLASEYTYETREDTKVFDINSNNGKLMYATVNEIVSPILKENKQLKKQLEEKENIARDWKDSCLENAGKIEILETQQKAFIKFLENELLDARYYARDIAHFIEYVLQKYKKLIGVSDETN